jgi:hypothetical protein
MTGSFVAWSLCLCGGPLAHLRASLGRASAAVILRTLKPFSSWSFFSGWCCLPAARMHAALGLGIVSLLSLTSFAQEVYEYNQSVADLGRGGVRLPRDTDGRAMLYNPAMLAFTKGVRWSILGVQGGINGVSNLTLYQNSPPSQTTISQYYGDNVWLGASGASALAFPHFGFAAYGNVSLDFLASNPVYPTINVQGFYDYGMELGWAFNITSNLAFGANIKRVTRTGGTASIGPGVILSPSFGASTIQNALTATGVGYGTDVGFIWRGETAFNPTMSLCWQDAGSTTFTPSAGSPAPPSLEDNLVLGLTTFQSYDGFGLGGGLEYRHINNVDVDISKKFNAGAEVDLGLIDVRGGVYQGWFGYGASVDLWLLTLDAAQYTIERGAVAGQNPETRIQVGLTFEAGFDPNFSLTDFGGKKRRLKQRR